MDSFRQCLHSSRVGTVTLQMFISVSQLAFHTIPSGGFKGEPLNTLQAVNETLLMGIPDSHCIFQVRTNADECKLDIALRRFCYLHAGS